MRKFSKPRVKGGILSLLLLFLFGCKTEKNGVELVWNGETYIYEFQYSAKEQGAVKRE
jgi:hypothetical protein